MNDDDIYKLAGNSTTQFILVASTTRINLQIGRVTNNNEKEKYRILWAPIHKIAMLILDYPIRKATKRKSRLDYLYIKFIPNSGYAIGLG